MHYFGTNQDLTPTSITLKMADRSMAQPEGFLEDVLVKVGKFIFPMDFVIMKMEEETQISFATRKTFLSNWSSLDRCAER